VAVEEGLMALAGAAGEGPYPTDHAGGEGRDEESDPASARGVGGSTSPSSDRTVLTGTSGGEK